MAFCPRRRFLALWEDPRLSSCRGSVTRSLVSRQPVRDATRRLFGFDPESITGGFLFDAFVDGTSFTVATKVVAQLLLHECPLIGAGEG